MQVMAADQKQLKWQNWCYILDTIIFKQHIFVYLNFIFLSAGRSWYTSRCCQVKRDIIRHSMSHLLFYVPCMFFFTESKSTQSFCLTSPRLFRNSTMTPFCTAVSPTKGSAHIWSFCIDPALCLELTATILSSSFCQQTFQRRGFEYSKKKKKNNLSFPLTSLPLNINEKVIQRLKSQANVGFRDEAIQGNLGPSEQGILQRFYGFESFLEVNGGYFDLHLFMALPCKCLLNVFKKFLEELISQDFTRYR